MDNIRLHIDRFKETFQKPSQIYRFLSERWRRHPLFLDRTLSYINEHRNQPPRKKNTNIDSICAKLLEKRSANKLESFRSSRQKVDHQQNGISGNNCDNGNNCIKKTPKKSTPVCMFNWICNDVDRLSQRTRSSGYVCPWCEKDYHFLDSMMAHLKCTHSRFNFCLAKDVSDGQTVVDMTLNQSFDGSYCGFKYPGHDLKQDFRFVDSTPRRRTQTTQIIFIRARRQPNSKYCFNTFKSRMSIDRTSLGNDEGEVDVDVCTGRLYYHTSTCLPIKPNEVDVDSEADMDPDWLRERTQLMIDEFTDVNEGEKEILKLWNLHIMKNCKYKGDGMMRQACLDFVELEGPTILDKNLTRNFTLHLANLFDFSLISNRDIIDCIRTLKKMKQRLSCCPTKSSSKAKLEKSNDKCQHTPPAKRTCLSNSYCNQ